MVVNQYLEVLLFLNTSNPLQTSKFLSPVQTTFCLPTHLTSYDTSPLIFSTAISNTAYTTHSNILIVSLLCPISIFSTSTKFHSCPSQKSGNHSRHLLSLSSRESPKSWWFHLLFTLEFIYASMHLELIYIPMQCFLSWLLQEATSVHDVWISSFSPLQFIF